MAKFSNGAYSLQLVETKDGHITGQLETVVINPDGKVVSNSLSVKGAATEKTSVFHLSLYRDCRCSQ
jgi:hypothetical protein